MNYTILDDNSFYAEGLRYALLYHGVQERICVQKVQWHQDLLTQNILFMRCRFSITGLHESLKFILRNLEDLTWRGCIYLLCDENGWALSAHMKMLFPGLTISIACERFCVNDVGPLLSKALRPPGNINTYITTVEYTIIYLLIKGASARDIAILLNITQKQVYNYTYYALKKLNARNVRQLLR